MALLGLSLVATSISGAQPSRTASIVLVLNPSSKAISTEIAHAQQIFAAVSRVPSLWMLGIYEQHSSNDGPPFNTSWLRTGTPSSLPRPELISRDRCDETKGTTFQKAECRKKHAAEDAENLERTSRWNRDNAKALQVWRAGVKATIASAAGSTEDSKRWDLAGTLARAGDDLAFSPGGNRCVVMLGGLFVTSPPQSPKLTRLAGVKVIASSWRATASVRTAWESVIERAGGSLTLLPPDVTEIALIDRVARCARGD